MVCRRTEKLRSAQALILVAALLLALTRCAALTNPPASSTPKGDIGGGVHRHYFDAGSVRGRERPAGGTRHRGERKSV